MALELLLREQDGQTDEKGRCWIMTSDDALERQIFGYLQNHRQAGDTLQGIAKWWLLCHRVDESVLLVKRTLEVLKTKGVVVERRLPDGSYLYFLNGLSVEEYNQVSADVTGVQPLASST